MAVQSRVGSGTKARPDLGRWDVSSYGGERGEREGGLWGERGC